MIGELAAAWLDAKQREASATEDRRAIEDRIKELVRLPDDLDGTETVERDGYTIKMVGRIDRKVNSEQLQELAAEAGLTDHLSSLFRWKPELNVAVWKATDESITGALAPAITAKPGRASFAITIKEK
ncbi:hypothetical protein UFOVP408_39 [uncultured Caudovirales phage]|uniref:Uncharacterized protein n=1 Tax=uncultured Caudovirales phage TaxID=2100421 RepID=A0A6J5NI89_9CAUD|nr:hypothetical protein UFOVP356_54 [uncultured Caudovirales phage]CAB4140571.1 hypothetical protein UFOVP408_39 [uncultured Caudovirales phage]CAB4156925.1 hypothetical protein UFOVP676_34 [uncultured Caudovirales phage]